MVINGVDSFLLYQNIKMGYTPSNATVLDLIALCEEAERLRDALKLYISAGFGESTDFRKQSDAYNAAMKAMKYRFADSGIPEGERLEAVFYQDENGTRWVYSDEANASIGAPDSGDSILGKCALHVPYA